MNSSKTADSIKDNEDKIVYPSCVHAVRPIDLGVEKTESQLEKVISAYDHIVDTAVAQLRLLENVNTAAPSSRPVFSEKAPAQQTSKPSAQSRAAPAQPAPMETKFSYKWPTDLKYPLSIAIKVNVNNIPATPWLFRRIFGSAVHIRVHRHSSYQGVIPSLINENAREYKLEAIKLIFTVIVHETDKLEFVVDPLRQGIIRDEHNLQRYLLRLLKIFSPMDALQDALSENYVDTVGRGLFREKQPNVAKKTLSSLNEEIRSKGLLVRPNHPTPADFSLLAASYEHDLRSFPNIESFRSNLETYFGLKDDRKQWFKAEA